MIKKIGLALLLTISFASILAGPHPTLLAQTGEELPAPIVTLTNDKAQYPLGLYLDYLADPTGQLTIDQVSSPEYAAQFVRSQQETLNFGINPQAHWVRFHLQNQTGREPWLLTVGLSIFDYVDLYSPRPDGTFQHQAGGDLIPFNQRDVPYRNIMFALLLPSPAEKTYYMRVQNKARLVISLELWSPQAFARSQYQEMFGFGLFYGVILIMMIYTLFLAALVKDRLYLFYSLYLLILSLAFLTFDGLAYQYLWPGLTYWNDVALYTFIGLGVVINLLFSAEFLQLKHYYPRLNRLLVALAMVYTGLTIVYAFITQNIVINLAINPGLVPGAILLIGVGWVVWRRGYQPAKYHLLFWGIICAATLLQNSSFFQFLPVNFFTENGMRLGVIIALPLLSLALADRVNVTRREKEMAQAAALTAAQEKESLIRQQKVLLEQQVAARTHELTQAIQRLEQEITERRQAEQDRRESQANISALIENTDGVIWSVDTAYRLIVGNSAFHRYIKTGFGREFAVGENILSPPIPEEVRDEWRGYYDRALRGEGFNIETQRRFVDQLGWMEYRFNPIYDVAGSISGVTVFGRNITEFKQIEASLRASEERYRLIVDNAPLAVALIDMETGRVLYANPRALELFKMSLEQAVGSLAEEYYVDPLDRILLFQQMREQGCANGFETRLKKGSGQEFWASITSTISMYEQRRVVHSVYLDITARKQAEAALREWEQLYRNIFDNIPDYIAITSLKDLHFLDSNRANCQMLGYSREELVHKGPLDFTPTENASQQADQIQEQLKQDGRIIFETVHLSYDGRQIPAEVHATLIDYLGQPALLAVSRDLTERKQTEEQLRKLSQAIEQSPSTVVITDQHGQIEYTNPHFTAITGYTLNEVLGQNPRLLKSGQHSTEFYQALWQTINAGVEWRGELANRKKNGELYTELASISPIRNEAGQITHFLKVAEDITERVRIEATLQRVYHELAALFALSTNMTSTLELRPLLELILERLQNAVDFSSATIITLTDTEAEIRLHVGPRARFDATGLRFKLADVPVLVNTAIRHEPLYLPNAPADPNFNRTLKHITQRFGQLDFSHLQTWLFIPLVIRQKVIGLLTLVHEKENFYNEQTREFARAFANQMALAIENATLYQQAQTAAVTEERSRLARELHDSVTQTLYSINLFTNATAMALSTAKPDVAQGYVQELRSLVNEAMLDMRLLIFELRPPVLEEGGLAAALRARLDAVETRSGIKAEFEVMGDDTLSLPVKGELYRIGQEALTNVVKHAQAQQVTVRLNFAARRVTLEISDNGVGFDLKNAQQSGKLGLRSIAERVEKIKGVLEIDSAPGRGTTLRVEVGLEEGF